jgi:hypothetical protein
MGEPHVISALSNKRAELAWLAIGRIENEALSI